MNLLPKLVYLVSKLYWQITKPITLGVRLLIVKDQSILLVKHTYQPSYWFLVGGGVKRSENLLEAARREAKEEVGGELGDLKMLGIYTNYFDHKSDHVIVFVCNDFTLLGSSSSEIEKYAFFPLANLPDGLAAGHKRRILEYLKNYKDAPFVGMW